MEKVNIGLQKDLEKLNKDLRDKYSNILGIKKSILKSNLSQLGEFVELKLLSTEELESFGNMITIDGSVNKMGGSYPHYIELYQGLGLVSYSGERIYKRKVYSPLMDTRISEELDDRKKHLAEIEIEVALETARLGKADIIMMDGGLIRYKIDAGDSFEELINICLDKNILLTGFVKEVKTKVLQQQLFEDSDLLVYDRDLLYGILEPGEAFIISDELNKKISEGFASMVLRGANYPGITGIDIIYEQVKHLKKIANLSYSLIPKMSRGVPMNIDMVDKEVNLSDKLTEELVLSYLDKDVIERFFRSERSMRNYWGEWY